MPKVTINNDLAWRGIVYRVDRQARFSEDGNLIYDPVPTEIDLPSDLAKILGASTNAANRAKSSSGDGQKSTVSKEVS